MRTSAMEAMVAYDWPGNVRQLARMLERVVALAPGPEIGFEDLPPEVGHDYQTVVHDGGRDDTLRAWSSRYVRLVLDRCEGNKRRACHVLNITYHTLQSHLDYGGGPLRLEPLDAAFDRNEPSPSSEAALTASGVSCP
jgi:DNA-binding NtrC family response regulator